MRAITQRVATVPGSATITTTEKAVRLKAEGVDIVDLSAGRAADAIPDYILAAARETMKTAFKSTPGQGTMELRKAAAEYITTHYGIPANPNTEIMATFGVKQILNLLIPSLMEAGESMIIEDPCFVSYQPLAQLWGSRVIPVPLLGKNRFRWTEEQLEQAVQPDTKAIMLCSPHNPTGVVHSRSDLEAIANVAKKYDLWVIADEIYGWTIWGDSKYISISTLPGMRERTISLVGLGKAFAMGAWRIGFVFASSEIIATLTKLLQHTISCVPAPLQAGATAALTGEPQPVMKAIWKDWEKRSLYMASELDKMPGISCNMPDSGYYVWPNITGTGLDSRTFAYRLLNEHHVAALAGTDFGAAGEGYMRVSIVRERGSLEKAIPRIRALAEACVAGKKGNP